MHVSSLAIVQCSIHKINNTFAGHTARMLFSCIKIRFYRDNAQIHTEELARFSQTSDCFGLNASNKNMLYRVVGEIKCFLLIFDCSTNLRRQEHYISLITSVELCSLL